MGMILCATRGGDESIHTQQKATDLAKERGDSLAFLYVVDSSFLNKTAAAVVVDVDDEISDMGNFILAMAIERAAECGITAEAIIRKGVIREVLPEVAKELEAQLIVVGRPAKGTGRFDQDEFDEYLTWLKSETGAEIIINREIPGR
jgi:nucleotide-binding universal stress UspA family protein